MYYTIIPIKLACNHHCEIEKKKREEWEAKAAQRADKKAKYDEDDED